MPWTCFLPFSRVSRSTLKDAEQRRPLPQAAGSGPSKPLLIYHPPCSPLFSNPIIFFGDPFTRHHLHQIIWRCAACEQPCLVSLSRRLNRWNHRFNWFIFFPSDSSWTLSKRKLIVKRSAAAHCYSSSSSVRRGAHEKHLAQRTVRMAISGPSVRLHRTAAKKSGLHHKTPSFHQ